MAAGRGLANTSRCLMGAAMRIRRVSGIAAVALTTVLGFGAALSSANPAGSGRIPRFQIWFSDRVPGILLPAIPLSLLLTARILSGAWLLSSAGRLSTIERLRPPGDYGPSAPAGTSQITYTPRPGLDQRSGSILQGIQ